MTGPQVILWYERAMIEQGLEKLLDFELILAPQTTDPKASVGEVQRALLRMISRKK